MWRWLSVCFAYLGCAVRWSLWRLLVGLRIFPVQGFQKTGSAADAFGPMSTGIDGGPIAIDVTENNNLHEEL